MTTIRELRSRIRAASSVRKITKAQELVAASRLTKARARVAAAEPYAREITRVLTELASASTLTHPLLTERPAPRRAAVLVITSDRGMCGSYNARVLERTEELLTTLRTAGKEPVLYVMGAKGLTYFGFRRRPVDGSWTGFSHSPTYADAADACRHLVDAFMAGADGDVSTPDGTGSMAGVDELHIVHTRFVSMLSQVPEVRRLAPIQVTFADESFEMGPDSFSDSPTAEVHAQYEFEPDADRLLSALLPKYINARIYASLLDAAASESAARRTAMKAASDKATNVVDSLTRSANSLRQAQITQEITEIVGGAEALA
ncbi:F0F1 ATP synthase subunit gamma [Nocardia otitidiscaviarum]|uniref:F0F1 ATP synthase subunit gamma n=1 Tax=Nocardia otitidiscaviarum TaxID=1823 RepID=UPI0004A6B901|nr:F0F1 ATP synthase subunit gamma [Nocardia otitidiscaviarum]MBF6136949.1 F0F1 ATP synthase subunit gamma [Nocardia otitidiscaviarum]MBF6485152.1 F0F1 ATP synthase subunit gamma [Nocardia otitidiscaviarum]